MALPTVNIKGKAYVEVKERVKYFRDNYPDHAIITVFVELNESFCVMRADIVSAAGVVATGHAREVNGDGNINKKSWVENCETSAIGRALGCFGIGISTSIASADEMRQTQAQTPEPKKLPKPSKDENKVIGVVFDTLIDSQPEGKQMQMDLLARLLYERTGRYPDDEGKANDIAKWLVKNKVMEYICIDTKE